MGEKETWVKNMGEKYVKRMGEKDGCKRRVGIITNEFVMNQKTWVKRNMGGKSMGEKETWVKKTWVKPW